MMLTDGLAMACRFPPDAELESLLPKLLGRAQSRGSLAALPLCGVGEAALPLL